VNPEGFCEQIMTPGVNDEGAHNETQRVSMRNEGVLCVSEKKKPGMPRPIGCLDPLEVGKVAITNPLGFFGRLGCSQRTPKEFFGSPTIRTAG
jgi:hypothetical protein